ncbi:MAG: hypothetical protein ACLFU7_06310 [Armatimonadota bacterium]
MARQATAYPVMAFISTALLISALLLSSARAEAQFPTNPDFSRGLDGWSVPEGCGLERSALSLRDGSAVSDASAEPLAGWQRVEVRLRGPGANADSSLSVALATAGDTQRPQVAVTAAEAGSRWRTLSAELLPPPDEPASVVIAVEDEERWLIDRVSVTPIELPESEHGEQAAVISEALPEGWEPEGLLDAVERPIGRDSELLVSVGALQVGMPARATASRGHRGSVQLIVRSRATADRALTVSATGPPGFFAPERTVTIRPDRDTVFKTSLQAFFVGTRWARLTFRSGDDEASAPIRVSVERSYPAPGVSFADGDLPTTLADALQRASIPMVAAPDTATLPDDLTRVRLITPPWTDEALRAAAAEAAERAEFAALHFPRGSAPDGDAASTTMRLRAALDDAADGISMLGPPADLDPGPPPQIAEADLTPILDLATDGAISAPTLRLPMLEARPVREVLLDRRPLESPQPSWAALSEALGVDVVSTAIRAGARLPMFFGELAARTTGSEEADAAMLARALVICAYQGATGWTVPARPQDAPGGSDAFCPFDDDGGFDGPVSRAYAELSRELAAAVPLTVLRQSPEIGSAPDAQIGFRPFIRNDEGILALWNNTGAPIDLAVEVRTQPLDLHTVSVGPGGVHREYVGMFKFSEDAITLNRPVVFVSLQPGELKLLSMQLARPHTGWLALVERKPRIVREDDGRGNFLEEWSGERGYR